MTPKPRPIIFSAPMVRALLAGRKTMTRRPADIDLPQADAEIVMRDGGFGCSVHIPGVGYSPVLDCPYGGPGSRLYVKEAMHLVDRDFGADLDAGIEGVDVAAYVADHATVPFLDTWPWQKEKLSPIHMPWGCRRLELEITKVGIEPLHKLTKEDAIAEGARRFSELTCNGKWCARECDCARWSMEDPPGTDHCLGSPQMAFANFYNKIHNDVDAWDSNPWVWVISFRVENRIGGES